MSENKKAQTNTPALPFIIGNNYFLYMRMLSFLRNAYAQHELVPAQTDKTEKEKEQIHEV